ncbi:DUF6199 family natural product biosynthesis protein [Camelliibacillus cellulosilyticus]|uniref:DUF6199 family natural product biosynthesis protein n=1 Tax=Camelliibacillus cellulosilyticus TaxID=2174486 RepID=A0ABV9GNW8_9BACL
MLLGSLFLLLAGLIMLIRPDLFYKLTVQWKSDDESDPSDLYIWSTRFGGVMCTLVGLSGVVVSIIYKY